MGFKSWLHRKFATTQTWGHYSRMENTMAVEFGRKEVCFIPINRGSKRYEKVRSLGIQR